jgi:hypothetical protein
MLGARKYPPAKPGALVHEPLKAAVARWSSLPSISIRLVSTDHNRSPEKTIPWSTFQGSLG